MISPVFQWAIRAAALLVPRAAREDWLRDWLSETWHYEALLKERGVPNPGVRIWAHCKGAFADAWQLRAGGAGIHRLQTKVRKPLFCLALMAGVLVAIIAGSRGLAVTRSLLAPGYPDADRLVLISEKGIMLGEQLAVSPALLDFWKAHNQTLAGMAGYTWDSKGTAWITPGFFDVLGTYPRRFLLREISTWKPAANLRHLGVIARLKPGVKAAIAQRELRDLASAFRMNLKRFPYPEAQVVLLTVRMRQPLYSYATICGITVGVLLAAALMGIIVDLRRSGRIRKLYWGYFCAKSVVLPLVLALAIWEFSSATTITLTGGTTFAAEPLLTWLSIVVCGGMVWWCLADQRARCRACLRLLEYPVRVGSPGAVLFDHAGTELVCCEGHGALYLPEISSDYVQSEGWTALDCAESVPR